MVLIDILRDEFLNTPRFKKYFNKSDLKESVNFIKYVNETYDINITNLAKIFNVSRQSIYKYLKMPTNKLPKVLLNKIVYIYGFHDFDEVLKMELILSFKYQFMDEIESYIEDGIQFEDIKHPYKFLFKPNVPKRCEYVLLKPEYNYEIIWKKSIVGVRNLEYQPLDTYVAYREFVSKHSKLYVNTVFKKLNKLNKDDYEIIRILDNYQNSLRRKNDKH